MGRLKTANAPDAVYEQLHDHFSEQEIVDLTLIIAFMNTWNRLSVGFRELPEPAASLMER